MIISHKQIMQLMLHMHDYIKTLVMLKDTSGLGLSEAGKINLSTTVALMNEIYNQQSDKLREVTNE